MASHICDSYVIRLLQHKLKPIVFLLYNSIKNFLKIFTRSKSDKNTDNIVKFKNDRHSSTCYILSSDNMKCGSDSPILIKRGKQFPFFKSEIKGVR